MTIRTIKKTVTFTKPFLLGDFDEELPAGDYSVETDEELLQGISFPAYRGLMTVIRIPAKSGNPYFDRVLTINPRELEAALSRDSSSDDRGSIVP